MSVSAIIRGGLGGPATRVVTLGLTPGAPIVSGGGLVTLGLGLTPSRFLLLGLNQDLTGAPAITGITAGETTAVVTWSGTASHYRINNGTAAALPDGTSPDTITGLTANTEYNAPGLQLGLSASGPWSTAVAFGTENPGTGGSEIYTPSGGGAAIVGVVAAGGGSSSESSVGGGAAIVGVVATGGGTSGSDSPVVTLDPVDVTVAEGATATFTVNGGNYGSVQWERDPAAAGSWSTISGAAGLSYTTPATSFAGGPASSGDRFRAVFSGAGGTATTEAATLTVTSPAEILTDASARLASRDARRRTLRATSERMVNYMLKRAESPEKNQFFREQVPGLVQVADFDAEIRGAWWTGSRLFVVSGNKLLEVGSNWTSIDRGTLNSATGRVGIAQGLLSLVIVDGPNGYTLRLADNTFSRIGDPDFLGSERVAFLDGKFIFSQPGTQKFFWSAGIDTADEYDALDFASAESAPDNIVGLLVDHREVWLFGEYTAEVWFPAPTETQVYQRQGASVEVGLAAAHTAQQVDNTIYFLGKDKRGQGIVWAIGGASSYTPIRISTNALEEQLAKVEDLSAAWAWTYQDAGQTFYVLQVPGLESTWVYDASVQQWHERAELVAGQLERWRAASHVFAYGVHLVGDSTGKLYELDPYEYTNAGDVLYRLWVTPHNAVPTRQRVFFSRLRLDVTTGETRTGLSPQIEMAYSNDGGYTWSDWAPRSSGALGEWAKPVKWDRLGMGRDRVWRFRCTDDAKVSIVGLHVDAREGSA